MHSKPRSLAASLSSDRGRVRDNNEDYASRSRVENETGEAFALWLVADGVGGGPKGEEASRLAVETVLSGLVRPWTDPAVALVGAYRLANERVRALTTSHAAATTLVTALVRELDGRAWVANVGDSRAYVLAHGTLNCVTVDHSLTGAEVAAGRMSRLAARTAPGRNVLTRALGSAEAVVVDVFGPLDLGDGDRLVLCTDGVYTLLDDATILRLASLRLDDAAGTLVEAAVAAGGKDNATACVGGRP